VVKAGGLVGGDQGGVRGDHDDASGAGRLLVQGRENEEGERAGGVGPAPGTAAAEGDGDDERGRVCSGERPQRHPLYGVGDLILDPRAAEYDGVAAPYRYRCGAP